MIYKYANRDTNYSAFGSGSVFMSRPGMVGFPIRLIHELTGRCIDLLTRSGTGGPFCLYDPCCGTASHIASASLLYGQYIKCLAASDSNEDAIEVAGKNLALLTCPNMLSRSEELHDLSRAYHKTSYTSASENALFLAEILENIPNLHTKCFRANAFLPSEVSKGLDPIRPHIIFADIPYGNTSAWTDVPPGTMDINFRFMDVLSEIINPGGVVCIVSEKKNRILHPAFDLKENLQVGKRRIRLFSSRK